MQVAAIILCLAATATGVALFVQAVARFTADLPAGPAGPDAHRPARAGARRSWSRSSSGHTRMSRLPVVAVAHWFVMVSFGLLFLTLVTAFGQLFSPAWALPLIGHFFLLRVGDRGDRLALARRHPDPDRDPAAQPPAAPGRGGRGSSARPSGRPTTSRRPSSASSSASSRCARWSTPWAATPASPSATGLHFPLTAWLGAGFAGTESSIKTAHHRRRRGQDPDLDGLADHHLAAADDGRGLAPVPGVLQHLVQARGRRAHGARRAAADDDRRQADRLRGDRGARRGRRPSASATIEDFTWKGLLDFTTCTECGRCQSQCPAWNTEKPLSPKLLMMGLRDHAYAQAPYLQAAEPASRGGADGRIRTRPRSAYRCVAESAGSSTPTCCGPARRAARASSSARSTSSTSTTSSTCGATRC